MFTLLHENQGKKIVLHRFIVKWKAEIPQFDDDGNTTGEIETQERELAFTSAEQKDSFIENLGETPHIVEEIDQSANEWANGMEVENFAAAERAIELGESAWESSRSRTLEEVCKQLDDLQAVITPVVAANLASGAISDVRVADIAAARGMVATREVNGIGDVRL